MASISSRKEIAGHPFSNVFSVSDGADVESASGIPYFYLSKLEMSVHDWKVKVVGVIPLEFVQQNETIIYCHVSVAETSFNRLRHDLDSRFAAHVILHGQPQIWQN